MTKEEEIKNEIWNIWQISLFAKECFSYSQYLHNPKTKVELEYIRGSKDFQFFRHILWRNTVIELAKLFTDKKDRDRFNIFHFLKKLKVGGQFGKMGIPETQITNWENQIATNSEAINMILTLRDKVYAHTDANKNRYSQNQPTFQETERLIDIVESVIQEIYSTIFDSHAIIETISFDKDRFGMVRSLVELRERETQDLIAMMNNSKK